jgi:hypothetical protein
MNPRKPYRCSKCKQVGHQSRSCSASTTQYVSLEGEQALKALVPESYAVWLVITGQGHNALIGALKAEAERTSLGFSPSQSQSNAYQFLCDRGNEVPPSVLLLAKRAAAALEEAQKVYAEATQPIRIALGFAKPRASESSDPDSEEGPREFRRARSI